jgi:hypothetical protein
MVQALRLQPVKGMPELFNTIQDAHPEMQIHYVSRAPHELMYGRHRRFLRKNRFPQGDLHTPKMSHRRDFKFKRISEILQSQEPGLVLLLGDDVEGDLKIYTRVVNEFSEKGYRFLVYIREISGSFKNDAEIEALYFSQPEMILKELFDLNILTDQGCFSEFLPAK